MRTRRMTRPTNALFSKKQKDEKPRAISFINNFPRVHKLLKTTPTMARRRDRSALESGEYGRPAEGVGASN
jgi:hypothetical protein